MQANLDHYAERALWRAFGSTIDELRQWFSNGVRHGCWCGPGNVCTDEQDDLDSACRRHDEAYAAVGVNTADGVSMWSVDGFRLTRQADRVLAEEAGRLAVGDEQYRRDLIWLFSTRATIGEFAEAIFRRWREFVEWLPVLSSLSPEDAAQKADEWAAYLAEVGVERTELAQVAAAEGHPSFDSPVQVDWGTATTERWDPPPSDSDHATG